MAMVAAWVEWITNPNFDFELERADACQPFFVSSGPFDCGGIPPLDVEIHQNFSGSGRILCKGVLHRFCRTEAPAEIYGRLIRARHISSVALLMAVSIVFQ